MERSIQVDAEVYDCLKESAEPFVDSPNSVLRRLLGLDPSGSDAVDPTDVDRADGVDHVTTPSSAKKASDAGTTGRNKPRSKRASKKRSRAPAGSTLPEEAYEMPLLESLVAAGGSGAARDIVKAVGERVDPQLTNIDREPLKSGAIRWENRIQFVRLKLIERGWLERNTPRGTWAISSDGRAQLKGGAA